MPFVPVPKDLTKVKTKVAFNLTRRQLVCFGGGALVGIPTYLLTRGGIGNDMAALLMIGLMLPFFLFGIYEKDGQPLEKVLGHIIRAQLLCPKVRPYQTDNLYAALERLNESEKEVTHIGKQTAGKASVLGPDAIEIQRRRLEWYAAQHGLTVVGSSEDCQPGTTMDRPGVQKMNRAVEQHTVDVVLVFSLDRLCRKVGDAIRYWHYLSKHDVRLCSVSDGEIDLSMDADIMKALSI